MDCVKCPDGSVEMAMWEEGSWLKNIRYWRFMNQKEGGDGKPHLSRSIPEDGSGNLEIFDFYFRP